MDKRLWTGSMIVAAVLTARAGIARADGDDEKDEQKISFKEAPKAVRKTFKREAGDVKIKSLDKESKKGKTVFEGDVAIDGHNYEVLVSEDGLLLSKTLDDEDEKKEADQKKSSKSEDTKKDSKEEHEDK